MANQGETTWASSARHLGVIDAILPDGHVHFGSDQPGQTQVQITCGFGASADEELLILQERPPAVPSFCGGAGNMAEHELAADDETMILVEDPPSSGQSTLDYVLQNLQCRTGNYRNRCFANAPFRLWSWAGSFLGGPQLWNRTGAAVIAALKDDGVVNITRLPTLQQLWQTFDDQVQDDASHFLMDLARIANSDKVIKGYYHVDYRQQVHRRESFPIHLISPWTEHEQELEQLIAEWANTAEGQVADGRGLWVGQIGRYELRDGEWTKHHQILNVPTIFNLPFTEDGNMTKTEQYSLIGLLCHSGEQHKQGHYYAIFVYRGVYWFVDDVSYPRPIPELTDSIKRQIVQVWAIPSVQLLPADLQSEFPSGSIEPHDDKPTNKKRKLVGVTQHGQPLRQWLLTRPRTPIMLVETHLNQEDFAKTSQWFAARGFGVLGWPAAESIKGGTHGGHMLLYPANMHFHFIHKQVIDGCGWYASQWSFANMEVILVMAYFRTGEGIQGHTNSQLWAGLISFVTSMTKQVIIAGDFNISPEEFMTTTMSTIMQVQVLASGEATCHSGNELDWSLVSTSLVADLSIKACWEVPFKPHAQLVFHWTQDLAPVAVQQIQKFSPAPKLPKPSREWYQIEYADVPVQWLNKPTTPATQQVGALCHKIERYVLQGLDKPTFGRGTQLQLQHKLLQDPSKPLDLETRQSGFLGTN